MRYRLKSLFLATAFVATWLCGYLYGIGFSFAGIDVDIQMYWHATDKQFKEWIDGTRGIPQ
jgi:hypothetical protein